MNKVLEILSKISNYIKIGAKWILSNLEKTIIIILLIVVAVLSLKYCSSERELAKTKAELIESVDTLTTYKNKLGEVYLERETYITDAKTLKHLNDSLYKEYKYLKDHPTVIVKTETVFKVDSIYVEHNPVVADTLNKIYTSDFNVLDQYYNIAGTTTFNLQKLSAQTLFNTISFPANFTTDLVERNNKLYFITKCDNPYVQINNIEGAVISPENSKLLNKKYNNPWVLALGLGPSVTLIDGKIKVIPAINLTLGFKIIDFKI